MPSCPWPPSARRDASWASTWTAPSWRELGGTWTRAGTKAELFEADVRDMPFPDGAFDVVFDFGTCYHIAESERALAEIARVLAPGGRLVYETPLGQLFAHPLRFARRFLPWAAVPGLVAERQVLLFASRVKIAP